MNCPKCQSEHIKKDGKENGQQRYKCNKCNHYWREKHKGWTFNGEPITLSQAAELFKITPRDLRRLFPKMPTHAQKTYADALEWYYQKEFTTTDKDGKISVDELKIEKLQHEVKKLRHDANRSKINEERELHDFEVQKGRYVDKELTRHRVADACKALADGMIAVPNRVASLLLQCSSEAEIKQILDAEYRKAAEKAASMPFID